MIHTTSNLQVVRLALPFGLAAKLVQSVLTEREKTYIGVLLERLIQLTVKEADFRLVLW